MGKRTLVLAAMMASTVFAQNTPTPPAPPPPPALPLAVQRETPPAKATIADPLKPEGCGAGCIKMNLDDTDVRQVIPMFAALLGFESEIVPEVRGSSGLVLVDVQQATEKDKWALFDRILDRANTVRTEKEGKQYFSPKVPMPAAPSAAPPVTASGVAPDAEERVQRARELRERLLQRRIQAAGTPMPEKDSMEVVKGTAKLSFEDVDIRDAIRKFSELLGFQFEIAADVSGRTGAVLVETDGDMTKRELWGVFDRVLAKAHATCTTKDGKLYFALVRVQSSTVFDVVPGETGAATATPLSAEERKQRANELRERLLQRRRQAVGADKSPAPGAVPDGGTVPAGDSTKPAPTAPEKQ